MEPRDFENGGYYTHQNGAILKYNGDLRNLHYIRSTQTAFLLNANGGWTGNGFRKSTPEETHWLNVCIQKRRFINKDIALRAFNPKHPSRFLNGLDSVLSSEGEMFHIGDTIPYNKICEFELRNNVLRIWHCDPSFSTPMKEGPSKQPGNCFWIENINSIKKFKQPLFTTEDGVDIFEGDTVHMVDRFDYSITDGIVNNKDFGCNKTRFSSKENAEDYVVLNKPCLTYGDIQEFLKVENCEKVYDLAAAKIKTQG